MDELKLDSWLFLKATNTTDTVTLFSTSNITFKLDLYNSTATADDKVFDYDNKQLYPINLNITSSKGTVDKKTAQLNETIKYNATSGGKGSITASIASASYTIELTNNKLPASIDVDTTPIILEIGDEHSIIATLNPSEAGNLTYTSNDTNIVVIDDTGKVIAIGSGHAQITISLSNTQYEATTNKTIPITVKYQTKFTINNIPDFTEGSSIDLIVNEKNNYTGPVTVTIGTENYNIDIINGTGKLTITPKLAPGTYTATIKFAGNENYTEANASSNSFKINAKPVPPSPEPVTKQNTKIIAKNKIYKLAKYKTYTVTVKNKKGKPVKNTKVQLKIGKKTYTSKTNKKGVATFKIPNKKSNKKSSKKSYKITATLNKNAKNDKLTLQRGSKTNKATTNKNGIATFKIKKTTKKIRKYSITLKTTSGQAINKQKVTLKVNKKTFKATTNTKGKAVFKINNLNKNGKYKTKIQYNGNKKYKATKKTVKIIIKQI
jgi:hypothetical protein